MIHRSIISRIPNADHSLSLFRNHPLIPNIQLHISISLSIIILFDHHSFIESLFHPATLVPLAFDSLWRSILWLLNFFRFLTNFLDYDLRFGYSLDLRNYLYFYCGACGVYELFKSWLIYISLFLISFLSFLEVIGSVNILSFFFRSFSIIFPMISPVGTLKWSS